MQVLQVNYQALFSELIQKEKTILGPDVVTAKLKTIPGIEVSNKGEIRHISVLPEVFLEELIRQFIELSGVIGKGTVSRVLSEYSLRLTSSGAVETSKQIEDTGLLPQIREDAQPDPAGIPSNTQMEELNKLIQDINRNIISK